MTMERPQTIMTTARRQQIGVVWKIFLSLLSSHVNGKSKIDMICAWISFLATKIMIYRLLTLTVAGCLRKKMGIALPLRISVPRHTVLVPISTAAKWNSPTYTVARLQNPHIIMSTIQGSSRVQLKSFIVRKMSALKTLSRTFY